VSSDAGSTDVLLATRPHQLANRQDEVKFLVAASSPVVRPLIWTDQGARCSDQLCASLDEALYLAYSGEDCPLLLADREFERD